MHNKKCDAIDFIDYINHILAVAWEMYLGVCDWVLIEVSAVAEL